MQIKNTIDKDQIISIVHKTLNKNVDYVLTEKTIDKILLDIFKTL